jgi:hypothetical protein
LRFICWGQQKAKAIIIVILFVIAPNGKIPSSYDALMFLSLFAARKNNINLLVAL